MDYTIALDTLKDADPILGKVIKQVGVCKLDQVQQSGDLLYSLSRSIIYQQLSTKAATAIHQRFLQLYGSSDQITPEKILNTSDETLQGAGISRPKIIYLKELAKQVETGLPTLEELAALDDETIVKTLTPIKGIGRWTVEMLLIFRLHRWDVLPVDDLGVRSSIFHFYQLTELPDKKTVERLGQKWKPYRTIASWYLWRGLEFVDRGKKR